MSCFAKTSRMAGFPASWGDLKKEIEEKLGDVPPAAVADPRWAVVPEKKLTGIEAAKLTELEIKIVVAFMNIANCLPEQEPGFWKLVKDIMDTLQTQTWKGHLIQRVCLGYFADDQGSDTMSLVAHFHNADEQLLKNKTAQGIYDIDKVRWRPGTPMPTFPPIKAYHLIDGKMIPDEDSDDDATDEPVVKPSEHPPVCMPDVNPA